jgi:hypothetical protein
VLNGGNSALTLLTGSLKLNVKYGKTLNPGTLYRGSVGKDLEFFKFREIIY